MAIRHRHEWVYQPENKYRQRCESCLMYRVSLNAGRTWGFCCSGDLSVALWDSEEGAMLSALRRLDRLVPVAASEKPHDD